MSWAFVSLAAAAPSPWRNGGGVTRELLAWPTAADWQVRISVADIQRNGAFSAFSGIERWFAVLEGEGVDLLVAGVRERLTTASDPLRFDGGASVVGELVEGATRDFNLMAPPGAARMQRVRGTLQRDVPAGGLVAVYAHARAARVQVDGEALEVPPATLVWRRIPEPSCIEADSGDALWMEVAL